MKYRLVMKINNNNYQPFDFNMLESYDNEDLSTLNGIDAFTSKYDNEECLKMDLLNANFIDPVDLDKDLKIIFYENNNTREYKYDLLFKSNIEYIDSDKVISFVEDNLDNYQALNKIYNEFNKRNEKSDLLIIILDVLRNIKKSGYPKNIYYINMLPYEERRSLAMYIYSEFYDIIHMRDKNEIRRTREK